MPFRTLADLRATPTPPWIWEGFLAPGTVTLVAAFAKVGKTTFLAHMIRAMWAEDMYLGKPIRPLPILIVSEEADSRIATRCDALGYSEMWNITWLTPEPGRTWADTMNFIRKFIHMYPRCLVIIDTLSRHWGIEDENDNAKVERVLDPIIALARTTTAAFCLVHHTRKSGGTGGVAARGGGALAGAVDIVVELTRFAKSDTSSKRRLDCYSRWDETPSKLVIELGDDGYTVAPETPEDPDAHSERTGTRGNPTRDFLLENPGWWTVDAIAAVTGAPRTTVTSAVKAIGNIRTKGRGTSNDPKQYTLTEV